MTDEQQTKPASLDDILKTAGNYSTATHVAKNQTYKDDLGAFYQYLQSTGRDPASMPGLDRDPALLSQQAGLAAQLERGNLVTQTESALKDIAAKLDQNTLSSLAFAFGNKDKDFAFYHAAVEKQDAEAIRHKYAEKYGKTKDGKPDELYLSYAANARPEHFLEFAQVEMQMIQNKFLGKNLYSEEVVKDKDGKEKKVQKYDSKKAQDYLVNAISTLKDDQKEEALFQLGNTIAQILAQEKAQKKKAK